MATTQLSLPTYKVGSGDTLVTISQQFLGSGTLWRMIADANGLSDPSALKVGQVLRIPLTEYLVQKGDTLSTIAQVVLGDSNQWRNIATLNNIRTPEDLKVGMLLKIPGLPVSNGTSTLPTAQFREYQVRSGDTLSTIAERLLSNANRWREIAMLNNIRTPSDLKVGMILKVPVDNPSQPAPIPAPVPTPIPAPPVATQPKPSAPATPAPTTLAPTKPVPPSQPPISVPQPSKPPAPTAPPPMNAARTYQVQPGDTLSAIARKTLGDPERWQEIARLNNITNPANIRVGQVLKLPALPTPLPVPSTYTVQPGDTLSRIAQRLLGDSNRWQEIARLNNMTNPADLKVGQVLRLPGATDDGTQEIAPVLNGPRGKQTAAKAKVKFATEGDKVFAIWPKIDFRDQVGVVYEKGLYRRGQFQPSTFINENRPLLAKLKLSDSEMKAIAATADNEGNLDAINTWDGQFLSFGIFQWTAGSIDAPGELGGLLANLKANFPEEFAHYFGQFGLNVEQSDGVRGWLTLNGARLSAEAQKNTLRQPIWAYRFALAGQDLMVQSTQVFHAVTRIDRFYYLRQPTLEGLALSNLITSEVGTTLLLDNHVNRPAYVVPCIAEALWRTGLTATQMAKGSDNDEQRVLDAYLDVRQTYGTKPMTHARQRGEKIRRLVTNGYLSDRRNSFISNRPARP